MVIPAPRSTPARLTKHHIDSRSELRSFNSRPYNCCTSRRSREYEEDTTEDRPQSTTTPRAISVGRVFRNFGVRYVLEEFPPQAFARSRKQRISSVCLIDCWPHEDAEALHHRAAAHHQSARVYASSVHCRRIARDARRSRGRLATAGGRTSRVYSEVCNGYCICGCFARWEADMPCPMQVLS